MLKRLIEVALPLLEVSEQSAREKSIRHGHISTLHIWWARRPLAACRAVIFASLIPDPDDTECPSSFRELVMDLLKKDLFRPTSEENGQPIGDTPRNRCLEFIKHLVRWENSNDPDFIGAAQKLIAAAHCLLHPHSSGNAPKVLDPFAGGGAMPLEALRLGCDSFAVDLNPVAHLLQLCTLVYPHRYGQPGSRPVPAYIKAQSSLSRAKKRKGAATLFETDAHSDVVPNLEVMPEESPTISEYEQNPLAADVRFWGHYVLALANRRIGHLYPDGPDGSSRMAYLWANTLPCPNPSCRATVPLIKQLTLSSSSRRSFHFVMRPSNDRLAVEFTIVEGEASEDQTPTIILGGMRCPVCQQGVYDKNEIKAAAIRHGLGTQPLCVVSEHPARGRQYQPFSPSDLEAYQQAVALKNEMRAANPSPIPSEPISRDFEWVLKPPMFGLMTWGDIFNARQQVDLATLASLVHDVFDLIRTFHDSEYSAAVQAYLALAVDRHADYNSMCQSWNNGRDSIGHTFGRQAISTSWDYCEANPFSGSSGDYGGQFE